MKDTLDWVKIGLVAVVAVVIAYFAGGAFFELVGEIYHWLDELIWAFFAGIVAFFVALWIVSIMIAITFYVIAMIFGLLSLLIN